MGPGELRASEKNAIALSERCKVLEGEFSKLNSKIIGIESKTVFLEQQLNSLRGIIASQMGRGPTES